MDGADDRASRVNGVADRPHDDGSGTGVQAAGRLIHEHDGRVGDELHRDGEPLTLLHAETALACQTSCHIVTNLCNALQRERL